MSDLKLVPPAARKSAARPKPREEARAHFARLARPGVRTLAVASGKGGVGKSTVVVNLAVALGELGARVVLFDGDLAQANLDLLLGVSSRWDLGHVLRGEKTLEQIVVEGPSNVRLVPAASAEEAEEVAHDLASLTRRFLSLNVQSLGAIPDDPSVGQAIRRREPVVLAHPKSPSAIAFRTLARRLWARPIDPTSALAPERDGRLSA